jgi:hypothetical protein
MTPFQVTVDARETDTPYIQTDFDSSEHQMIESSGTARPEKRKSDDDRSRRFSASYSGQHQLIRLGLTIKLQNFRQKVIVEPDQFGHDLFFAMADHIQVSASKPTSLLKRVGILWDSSRSRGSLPQDRKSLEENIIREMENAVR